MTHITGDPGKFRDSRPLKVDMESPQGPGAPSDLETRQTLRVARRLAGCRSPLLGTVCPRLWLGPRPSHPAQAQVLFLGAPHR